MLETRHYVRRCHELALLGIQNTSPNPVVGAVIVANKEIIGEGWHRAYGEEHAEIRAINSVGTANRHQISDSTIFVSLEPCSIFGNTPPCTDAIINEKIKNIVVSSRDLTEGVNRVSEYILKKKGLNLTYGVNHDLGDIIATPRNTFVSQKRPYFILKWAQSSDGFIGNEDGQTAISNAHTSRYVHQLRSEVDAILVGKRTAIIDDPSLTNRFYSGKNPMRIVLGNLNPTSHSHLRLLNDGYPTLLYGKTVDNHLSRNVQSIQVRTKDSVLETLCQNLHDRKFQKVLVEGGAATLQSFIDAGLWDECRIITNPRLLNSGIKAPVLLDQKASQSFSIFEDRIEVFHNF